MEFQTIKPYVEKSFQVIIVLLVMALAYQLAQLTLTSLNNLPLAETKIEQVEESTKKAELPDIQRMLEWHIFGEFGKVVVDDMASAADAPETKLDFELQGVSVSLKEEHSSAIISESKGSSGELFWVGDSVFGKAILSAVFDEKVVLKLEGRVETLHFLDELTNSGLTKNSNSASPPSGSRNTNQSDTYQSRKQDKDSVTDDLARALNEVGQGKFAALDSLLDGYGANLEGKLSSAASKAGLEKTSEGVRVSSRVQPEWMNKLGMKPGDTIKSVNNYPLQSLMSDKSAIKAVAKSCVARIEVQRAQNTFALTYPFCN
jgi:general secretion pathway protein C